MHTISEQKNNILAQLEPAFVQALWFAQEAERKNDNIGEIKNALQNARNCGEAICKYLILEKTTQHNKINKELYIIIEFLYDQCVFDPRAAPTAKEKGNNGHFRTDFHRLRFKGNKGSHIEPNEELNPTFQDCKKLIQLVLIERVKWFYEYVGLSIPPKIQDAIEQGVNENDLPKFSDWYSLESDMGGFADRFSHYFLITFPNFRKKISEYELNLFAKSRVEWKLVIDFDHETQEKGLEWAFKNILGNERIRTLLKGNDIPDFRGLYYFLAQGNSSSDIIEKPAPWANTQGKALEKLLNKIEVKKAFIVIIGNEPKLISKSIEIISRRYASVAKTKITLAIITDNSIDKQKIEEEVNDEGHNENFLSIQYYHFEFPKLVTQGFGLTRRSTETPKGEYAVPAYDEERKHIMKVISNSLYEDLHSKYIELVYEKIGKKKIEQTSEFYMGEEITWQDIVKNKGKDLERNKVNQVFIPELIELLQESRKGFYKYQINHEASAGGTTVAKRIAYEIGRGKLPISFPTVLIKKYISQETAKTLADLYEQTGDKPILAVIEEFEVGKIPLQNLEDEIRSLQKTLVVLYICRNNSKEEREGKVRRLPSALEAEEMEVFEQVFSDLNPTRKSEIEGIKNLPPKFATPFIYGFTAYGKDFKKFENYIKFVLDEIKPFIKAYNFLGFVALIDRYTQVPIPESLFYNYLEIPEELSLENTHYYEQLETLISFTYNKDEKIKTLKMRNNLFTEEVSEIIISGGNPELRHNWKNNLKNKLLELIDIRLELN